MRILFDHCTPRPLRRYLPGYEVKTTYEMGWSTVKNGKLLLLAEIDFDIFITTDQNIPTQQNFQGRQIAIVILVAPNNKTETLVPLMPQVNALLPGVEQGRIYVIRSVDDADTPSYIS